MGFPGGSGKWGFTKGKKKGKKKKKKTLTKKRTTKKVLKKKDIDKKKKVKKSACQCRRQEFEPWVRKMPWRRKLEPTPVFLPEESHGQRSLVDYNPWGSKKSWT